MRWFLGLAVACGVAGCGADGEPVPPTRDATITLSSAGVSGAARIGFGQGPVSVSVGVGL